MKFGENFKSYRLRMNLSQKEAADLIGIKPYQLANYETNRSEPSIQILKNMSLVYQVSIDRLVNNIRLKGLTPSKLKDFEEEKEEFARKLEEVLDALKHWNAGDSKIYPGEE